jgi:hypothetical protein
LQNPTLSDLVGGIEAVTLSDEEARRRGTQKTVLERRAPPTFDILIEIQSRDQFAVHQDVTEAVDAFLRGYPLLPEIRTRDSAGQIRVEKATPAPAPHARDKRPRRSDSAQAGSPSNILDRGPQTVARQDMQATANHGLPSIVPGQPAARLEPIKIYPYGVARNRLMQAAKRLGVPAIVVRELDEANALITLRAYYRNRQQSVIEAEQRGVPIYVLRANTVSQMEQFLTDLYNLPGDISHNNGSDDSVRYQTQAAISAVLNGERYVDMPPANAVVRRIQHEMARAAELVSHSYGKEPRRYVRIFRD